MPSSNNVRITMETPPEIGKLSEEETDLLKKAFGAALANVLGDKLPQSLLELPINNVTNPPDESVAPASRKRGGKGASKAAKRSSKKG